MVRVGLPAQGRQTNPYVYKLTNNHRQIDKVVASWRRRGRGWRAATAYLDDEGIIPDLVHWLESIVGDGKIIGFGQAGDKDIAAFQGQGIGKFIKASA